MQGEYSPISPSGSISELACAGILLLPELRKSVEGRGACVSVRACVRVGGRRRGRVGSHSSPRCPSPCLPRSSFPTLVPSPSLPYPLPQLTFLPKPRSWWQLKTPPWSSQRPLRGQDQPHGELVLRAYEQKGVPVLRRGWGGSFWLTEATVWEDISWNNPRLAASSLNSDLIFSPVRAITPQTPAVHPLTTFCPRQGLTSEVLNPVCTSESQGP